MPALFLTSASVGYHTEESYALFYKRCRNRFIGVKNQDDHQMATRLTNSLSGYMSHCKPLRNQSYRLWPPASIQKSSDSAV